MLTYLRNTFSGLDFEYKLSETHILSFISRVVLCVLAHAFVGVKTSPGLDMKIRILLKDAPSRQNAQVARWLTRAQDAVKPMMTRASTVKTMSQMKSKISDEVGEHFRFTRRLVDIVQSRMKEPTLVISEGTRALVWQEKRAGGRNIVGISFRSTATWSDVSTDLYAIHDESLGVKVHAGFVCYFRRIWPALSKELLRRLDRRTLGFEIFGFSMGAAVALILALQIEQVSKLPVLKLFVTSLPPVGESAVSARLMATTINFESWAMPSDFVACLPEAMGFHHVVPRRWIASTGPMSAEDVHADFSITFGGHFSCNYAYCFILEAWRQRQGGRSTSLVN
jgi:hypothetical protein